MQTVRLILVGGFLGAGKTTLLWEAARRLIGQGKRVGLITNDQAPDLVDTGLLRRQGLDVREVAGSCFCCNFPALIAAAGGLRSDVGADVLLAEPVGSCTDLSATILQPLKEHFKSQFVLSPLSVLADAARLADILGGRCASLHPSAAYIARKQLEEADWVVVNKVDLLSDAERDELGALVRAALPEHEVWWVSAKTGEGVDAWLQAVTTDRRAGRRVADVDYDTYAAGEAVLGWLNAVVALSARGGAAVDWRRFCERLLGRLREACSQARARVGHVKMLLSAAGGHCVGNLTQTEGPISVRGDVAPAADQAELTLNARVEMPPPQLKAAALAALADAAGDEIDFEVRHLRCLSPGRPKPTYRYDSTV